MNTKMTAQSAKATDATKNLTEEQKKTMVVSKEVKQEPKPHEPKKDETQTAPSVDLVLAKLYDKMEVAKKLEYLKEQKKELNSFVLGDDRLKTRVTLEDAAGREWVTANGFLLNEIFSVCKRVVDEKIKDAEVELLAA